MQAIARPDEPLLVQIGGRLVEGWITEAACPTCGGAAVYMLAYDATCCPECNQWLDILCPDPDCMHCSVRPGRPLTETVDAKR
jgi:hypothetical protein